MAVPLIIGGALHLNLLSPQSLSLPDIKTGLYELCRVKSFFVRAPKLPILRALQALVEVERERFFAFLAMIAPCLAVLSGQLPKPEGARLVRAELTAEARAEP